MLQGPELRTIFLGMDQKRDELLFSSVKGKNPFKDVRVRQAFYQAIDDRDDQDARDARRRDADRPDGRRRRVRGFQPDMNKRLPYDAEAAKKLLADAGYPNGFEVGMNCPNDRYVNDAAICQAVAANLARIGVKVNLQAETKVSYFPKILRRDTSFYLLGWTPEHGRRARRAVGAHGHADRQGPGPVQPRRLQQPEARRADARRSSPRPTRPSATTMIREAFKIHQDDVGHIPLHQQALAWAHAART